MIFPFTSYKSLSIGFEILRPRNKQNKKQKKTKTNETKITKAQTLKVPRSMLSYVDLMSTCT